MRASGAFYIAFATRMSRIMCTTSTWDVRGMLLRQHVTLCIFGKKERGRIWTFYQFYSESKQKQALT
jgi:hypothetical protein